MPEPLLAVRDLHAWYGESHVLHGVDFEIHAGEMVTLLGRNGAGKTTTLKSNMGIVARRRGSVRYDGHELIDLPSRVTISPAWISKSTPCRMWDSPYHAWRSRAANSGSGSVTIAGSSLSCFERRGCRPNPCPRGEVRGEPPRPRG